VKSLKEISLVGMMIFAIRRFKDPKEKPSPSAKRGMKAFGDSARKQFDAAGPILLFAEKRPERVRG